METALKLALVVLTAPFWYGPVKVMALEIRRVLTLPEESTRPVRLVGNRARRADKAFQEVAGEARKQWARDDGRISNPRWETGRRPVRSRARTPDGAGFQSTRRRSGYNANKTRFGSAGWQGGFGRR